MPPISLVMPPLLIELPPFLVAGWAGEAEGVGIGRLRGEVIAKPRKLHQKSDRRGHNRGRLNAKSVKINAHPKVNA